MILLIVIIISIIISACYFGLIIFFTYGWLSNHSIIKSHVLPKTRISVIVPFRNEEENILPLLKSLIEQNYPSSLLEVVIVDDHSTDQGLRITKEFIFKNGVKNFHIFSLSESDGFSKKAALQKGIENSNAELIVTTDADCIFGKNWLSSLSAFYEQENCRLISAPVVLQDRKGFFSCLQTLEFLSLIASGAGAMSAGKPILANGANFCFERSLYDELNGYKNHKQYASGDDVFLLLEAKKHIKHKNELRFLKNTECIVFTKGAVNLKEFINQRIRWASKSTAYKDSFAIYTTISVALFNLSIPVLLFFGFFNLWFAFISATLFIGKLIVDFPIMFSVARFVGKLKIMWYYIPMQLTYPLYIIIVAALSLFMPFKWKGRKRRT